jgi:hypothetical protein
MIGSPTILARASAVAAACDTGAVDLKGAGFILVLVTYSAPLTAGHGITATDEKGNVRARGVTTGAPGLNGLAFVLGPGTTELAAVDAVVAVGSRLPEVGGPSLNGDTSNPAPKTLRVQTDGSAGAGITTRITIAAVVD